jgi:hypothetical protein
MRAFKFSMMAVLCSSSLSPIMLSPAMAVTANGTTSSSMAATCAALIPNAGAVLNVDGSLVWSSAVVNITEVENAPVVTDAEIPGTRAGSGTPTYGGLSITGNPFRIGGSVNMFGDQVATTRTFPASTFQFNRVNSVTTNYTFGCELTQKTEFYTPPFITPGTPMVGHHINCDFGNGQGNDNGGVCDDVGQPQGSCAAHTAQGPTGPFWGRNTEQCRWVVDIPETPEVVIPGFWTRGADIVTVTIGQTASQTDVTNEFGLTGTDYTPFTQTGNYLSGKVVVCISPSKTVKGGVPGAWQNHNGYTGTKCNTTYFNTAPWGGGSQDSNGTYISVPAV